MSNHPEPSPSLFFDTINAYQKTAAIKSALELEVFTAIGDGVADDVEIAKKCGCATRGIRILCDSLTVLGFLVKSEGRYTLTPDSATFLNRKSPAYAGGAVEFLQSPALTGSFSQLTGAVRKGGTAQPEEGSVAPEHPMWIAFARSMGGLMVPGAAGLAELVPLETEHPAKILDVSASHGLWGLAFARKHPRAQIVAVDWAPVLEVARENACKAGVASRFSTIAGNAFDVDLGSDYDAVLLPNFLHHFDVKTCVQFLRRVNGALRPDGHAVIVEFVPNADRVTPPPSALFSLVMLATTPAGDAYTLAEYADMLAQAGFKPPTSHSLPASMSTVVIALK